MNAKVQASEVTYELHTLGWKAFQHLCATIFSDILGHQIQTFFESHDGGRDGAFSGEFKKISGHKEISLIGNFTVQCKFTSEPNKILKLIDLTDELNKAKKLAEKGFCDHYIICTNAKHTGSEDEKITAAFKSITKIQSCTVYGKEALSQFIKESPKLRMLIPRVYGLGDLSQILDERAYSQARAILSSIGDDLQKFVITESYNKSLKAIETESFVLLLGEPACGKSTVASILAMGALDRWKCHTIKCNSPDDFHTHYNPHEKQFFWIDDAFGATQLSQEMTSQWNHVFPMINSAIKHGSKFVFTSRDYIYRAAKHYLKETALPLIKESQVVIEVKKLTLDEKKHILYNHIKLGNQPLEYKKKIKPFLVHISKNDNFTPEIARRLGNKEYTKNLILFQHLLDNFINYPMDFLKDTLTNVDKNVFSALALVFMHNGVLPSPIVLKENDEYAIQKMGGNPATVSSMFKELNETFLKLEYRENNNVWVFKHPTLRDALASMIAEDPELLDVYLSGTPLNTIFSEVSCGDIHRQKGIKIIIPENRYDQLIVRIDLSQSSLSHSSLNSFLAHRCKKSFLDKFLIANPCFIENITLTTYNRYSQYEIINKLFNFKLLPEGKRLLFIKQLTDWAINIPNAIFLNDFVVKFITIDEKNRILDKIKIELLPKLSEVISDWVNNFNKEDDYFDDYFHDLVSCLDSYLYEFEYNYDDGEECVIKIEAALEKIKEEINNLPKPDEDKNDDDKEISSTFNDTNQQRSSRSIFDDVDE